MLQHFCVATTGYQPRLDEVAGIPRCGKGGNRFDLLRVSNDQRSFRQCGRGTANFRQRLAGFIDDEEIDVIIGVLSLITASCPEIQNVGIGFLASKTGISLKWSLSTHGGGTHFRKRHCCNDCVNV